MPIDKTSLKVISESAEKRTSVFFSAEGLDILFQTFVMAVKNDSVVLKNPVDPALITTVVRATRFFMQCQMIQFVSDEIASDGVNIVFPLHSLKEIEETRLAQRFPFDSHEQVTVKFFNPFDGETLLTKTVMDMSATGLSIHTPFSSSLFEPGRKLKGVRILIDNEPYNHVDAEVVYKRRLYTRFGKMHVQVGLKFIEEGP
jgi:hypothetical protein